MLNENLQHQVTQCVKSLRQQYISSGKAPSYFDINNGHCDEFADELEQLLIQLLGTKLVSWVELDNFTHDGEGEKFDEALLAKYWSIAPPAGWTWAQLDAVGFGRHAWVAVDGRHYDAECPEGVASFFDLPLFRRYMITDMRNRGIACADVEVEDVEPAPVCPVPNPSQNA